MCDLHSKLHWLLHLICILMNPNDSTFFFSFSFFAWLPIQAPYVFFCRKMSPQDYPLLYGSVQILQHHRAAHCHVFICFLIQRELGLCTWSIHLGVTT